MNQDIKNLEEKFNARMDIFEIRLKQFEMSRGIEDLTNDFLAFKSDVLMSLEHIRRNIMSTNNTLDDFRLQPPATPQLTPDTDTPNGSCSPQLIQVTPIKMTDIKNILTDTLLQEINKKLKVDDDKKNEYISAFEELYLGFRTELNKTDPLFTTYQKKINIGSHAIRTRVGLPNEFDVNLCIKLPLDLYKDIKFSNCTRPGYIQIKTSLDNWNRVKKNQVWEKCQSIEKWVDADGYLLESRIRTWMESKVQSVITNLEEGSTLNCGNNNYKINVKKSGPAFTLCVQKEDSTIKFDVDLVPSIVFEYPNWPCNVKEKYIKEYKSKDWFAVAKPLSTDKSEQRFWRPSFTNQEIEMLSLSYHMKSAIRLIKALRDNNQLSNIATYHINTLFMWKKTEEPENYWEKPLSDIFSDMLMKLDKALTDGKIPCFWNKQQNLLDSLSPNKVKDASSRLKGILKNIAKNPSELEGIILGTSRNSSQL